MKNELLTSTQMRAAEEAVLEKGTSEQGLMERAGESVVDVILSRFSPCRVSVVCGPGKNGGDGKVVARLLKEKGWAVETLTWEALPPVEDIQKSLIQTDLIVDGLLGTGLSRPLEGILHRLVQVMNEAGKPIVAIDIPTGVDTNSGLCWGKAVHATVTVTFCRAKPGHYLLPGRLQAGELFVKDIGIPDNLLPPTHHFLNEPSLWNLKASQPSDHKYTRGACLIIGNGCMPGAIRMAALAARRIGAGLVRMTCEVEEYPILASTTWGDIITPVTTPQELQEWIFDERFKALLWGPGAPPTQSTQKQTLLLLSTQKPCVLDGGVLSSFEGQTQELVKYLHGNVILTPHEGEFQRLFPHLAPLKNKAERALKAAKETGAAVVLKGYDTVIASPQGDAIINANAPPTLATAGTGDVLAGLMAGLLAQGVPPFHAAAAAVWIQGDAANRYGLGLIAEDLLDEISVVLQGIY